MTTLVNQILSILTVAGQAVVLLILILYFFDAKNSILAFFSKNSIKFSFIVALVAMLGSLFFSEIAGYEPCMLCWFQRIFMYPQVFLLGLALWKKEKIVAKRNSIMLSVIGAVIASYHYLLQIGIAPELPCSATGYSVACSQRFIMSFGYITIPMMALTAFLLILVFLLSNRTAK